MSALGGEAPLVSRDRECFLSLHLIANATPHSKFRFPCAQAHTDTHVTSITSNLHMAWWGEKCRSALAVAHAQEICTPPSPHGMCGWGGGGVEVLGGVEVRTFTARRPTCHRLPQRESPRTRSPTLQPPHLAKRRRRAQCERGCAMVRSRRSWLNLPSNGSGTLSLTLFCERSATAATPAGSTGHRSRWWWPARSSKSVLSITRGKRT